ncbi:polymorphic toxin type 30 domain-containing protein [Cytobacillus massiliigabonensis]|uniref:polymorphic toxin type 30 domain-containing protein n=1 Tax=Cytobacillus massiliigabonensis TaxID=1871011 RepID=UPI000C84C5D4|nr:polymorphic toxin type 30 domain-containing protein [Cytobacillus massiliigabonensis]
MRKNYLSRLIPLFLVIILFSFHSSEVSAQEKTPFFNFTSGGLHSVSASISDGGDWWDSIISWFESVGEDFQETGSKIKKKFESIKSSIAELFGAVDDGVQTFATEAGNEDKKANEINQSIDQVTGDLKNNFNGNDEDPDGENEDTKGKYGEDVSKLGTGAVGDFTKLEGATIDEVLSRIPKNATRRELTPVEGKVTEGFEYKWSDDGKTMRVRIHGPDASAPDGSNAKNNWIVRVQQGKKYLDPLTGEFQPPGITNENSPYYNEDLANRTHIPIKNPKY